MIKKIKKNKDKTKSVFPAPKIEPYIGTHMYSEIGGKKASNKSSEKYSFSIPYIKENFISVEETDFFNIYKIK